MQGRPGLAQARVQTAIGGDPVSAANLDLYYWLARTHEASSDAPSAIGLFKQIQAESLGFRDVNDRGVLVICDPRLRSRSYGPVFLESLPPMTQASNQGEAEEFLQ